MDPFFRSKVRDTVSEVLYEMKQARLEELKKFYSEYPDISFEITKERRLLEAEIKLLRSKMNTGGYMGPL